LCWRAWKQSCGRASGPVICGVTGYEIWGSTPEKVFGVNSIWAETNPRFILAMIRALEKACTWVDEPEIRTEALEYIKPSRLSEIAPWSSWFMGWVQLSRKGSLNWPMEAYQRFSGHETK